jgi:hypothetical protein
MATQINTSGPMNSWIDWDAIDIKPRLFGVPVLTLAMNISSWIVLSKNVFKSHPEWQKMAWIRCCFFIFFTCILINNLGKHRRNVINVWQHIPSPSIGFIGMTITLFAYYCCLPVTIYIFASGDDLWHIADNKLLTSILVTCEVINIFIWVMGLKLFTKTYYMIITTGDRTYEMMPVERQSQPQLLATDDA